MILIVNHHLCFAVASTRIGSTVAGTWQEAEGIHARAFGGVTEGSTRQLRIRAETIFDEVVITICSINCIGIVITHHTVFNAAVVALLHGVSSLNEPILFE